jgi:transposase
LDNYGIERRGKHKGNNENAEWRDKERLRELYLAEALSTREIAERFDCSPTTVSAYLQKYDIPRRHKGPTFVTTVDGYETVRHRCGGEYQIYRIHRLVALAQGKIDVDEFHDPETHIHHKNKIPWDNRPENLQALSKSDHHKIHANES